MGLNTITMTKVVNEVKSPPPSLLDTSAQPLLDAPKALIQGRFTQTQFTIQKRASAKLLTDALLFPLIDLESDLNDSYWSTYHCTRTILQIGSEMKTQYCNQRWCMVCNRIRGAKLDQGYSSPIQGLKDPYFITLTQRTVTRYHLARTIGIMLKTFNLCKRVMEKEGVKIIGIRKTEVEVEEDGKFHPHYHVILDGEANAKRFVELWVSKHPMHTDMKAQEVKPCYDPREIFKYFTKMLTRTEKDGVVKYNPEAMDVIFKNMKGKRVFQPFGKLSKHVDEDIEVESTQEIDWKYTPSPDHLEIWTFEQAREHSDWYNANGEPFAEYNAEVFTEKKINFIESISNGNEEQRG